MAPPLTRFIRPELVEAALPRRDGWRPFPICAVCVNDCDSECFWSLAKKRARLQKTDTRAVQGIAGLQQRASGQDHGYAGAHNQSSDRIDDRSESSNDGDTRRPGSRKEASIVSIFTRHGREELEGIDKSAMQVIVHAEADIDFKVRMLHQSVKILEKEIDELADQLGTDLHE